MAIREAGVVDWTGRYEELTAREAALAGDELDELGQAAWFVGRDDVSVRAWERAHLRYLDDGDLAAAVRCVFWLGFTLSEHGDEVRAGAWMARLVELCGRADATPATDAARALCVAVGTFARGEVAASIPLFHAAIERADAAADADGVTLGAMGLGRALLATGRMEEAFAEIDRVMLLIADGRVSDRAAGPAYCAAIASLLGRGDIERARVWTRELGDWCDAQRGLEPFRGECTLHRAGVLQLGGEWEAAASAIDDVCATEKRGETLANAWYRAADLHRVAGRSGPAREAMRRAASLGREVQPGLALLHRDTGDLGGAWAGLEAARTTPHEPVMRAEMAAAAVRVALDRGRLSDAAAAADDLRACAATFDTRYLRALSSRADGEVALAEGRAPEALALLRASWAAWRRLDAPYDAALTRISIGAAIRDIGDAEGAELEFDAARGVLEGLGAIPDLARLERVAAARGAASDPGLSRREREVLALVARGWSNRRIAEHLFLSERTVARHVGSILAKLGVPSRSAATAYAFEHGLAVAT
ncbi:ATP/maltotriose-dependent transcriptional regulator MalT [Microbacterium trichothecenolyticum]|uniref:response regulator transcription factor n=1 Tax=Microbacterium trichothecenolyticum TaxID=69370 RepID=UPI00285D8320|nr:response regulator transcription factor [Microbacterium trichothecenolyticum]MDR7184271.1 ATP/maltotriose-dependent transcriptional regulator MalT [Microbacterium trichothecenolyticum]